MKYIFCFAGNVILYMVRHSKLVNPAREAVSLLPWHHYDDAVHMGCIRWHHGGGVIQKGLISPFPPSICCGSKKGFHTFLFPISLYHHCPPQPEWAPVGQELDWGYLTMSVLCQALARVPAFLGKQARERVLLHVPGPPGSCASFSTISGGPERNGVLVRLSQKSCPVGADVYWGLPFLVCLERSELLRLLACSPGSSGHCAEPDHAKLLSDMTCKPSSF